MKKKQQVVKKIKQPKHGFTLIEILVATTIIIIISAIGLVSYSGAQVSARDAQRKQDLENVRTTLLLFRSERGYYPVAGLHLDSRVSFSFPRQVVARLSVVFRVPTVRAATSDSGFESVPVDDSLATPPPSDAAKTTPTPSMVPQPPVTPPPSQPEEAIAYGNMMEEIVAGGYMQSSEIPYDPINNSSYYYGYDSPDGSAFTLTARLEKDGSVVTLTD